MLSPTLPSALPPHLVRAPLSALGDSRRALHLRLGLQQETVPWGLHHFQAREHACMHECKCTCMHIITKGGSNACVCNPSLPPHLLAPLAAPLLPLLPSLPLCILALAGARQLLQTSVHLPAAAAAHQRRNLAGLPAPNLCGRTGTAVAVRACQLAAFAQAAQPCMRNSAGASKGCGQASL